ncbi:calcium-binding protein P [Coregonus clupeaformis]|uniref:calcium-binding protein P n=1 Tax=Coregonus clupeaformis TaxID=59861 RepID=UPI001E1C6697|nr:calcium-binding protein P [Coregonus clupeaformis]
MDPNKMPSAPPPGWNPDEKSGIGQPAPPPYQDHPQYPNAGYPAPAGYPPNPQGYAQPSQYGGAPGAPYGQTYPQGQFPPGQYTQSTVTVQPTVFVTQGALPFPLPDYLGYSIFTMLCCCLPLGIAALIYSISTRDANNQGHQQIAERSSRLARILNHAALGIGITVIILYIVYAVILASSIN